MTRNSKVKPARPSSAPRLRPSERVLKYLLDEFERPDRKEGTRLPTVRELVERLGVSLCTVHSVFKKLSQEGRIRTEVGKGTFLVGPAAAKTHLAVGINFPIPDQDNLPIPPSQNWVYAICSGIMQGTLNVRPTITFLPLSHQTTAEPPEMTVIFDQCAQTDGAILFPYGDQTIIDCIRDCYRQSGKPVIELNPPTETATTGFVSPDYYGPSLLIGKAWRKSGRRKVVLLSHCPLARSVSGRLRLAGLTAGLVGEETVPLNCTVLIAQPQGVQAVLGEWLTRHSLDAIYCTSDDVAVETLGVLRDKGYRIPEDVSVIGGSGVDLSQTICPGLTRTAQPMQQLGKELVNMLLARLRSAVPVPGRYFNTTFIGGVTTLPQENEILGIIPA